MKKHADFLVYLAVLLLIIVIVALQHYMHLPALIMWPIVLIVAVGYVRWRTV